MRILGAILAAFLLAVLPLESLGSADSCPRAIPVPPAARLSRRIWNAGDPLAARFLPALRGGGEPKPAKDGESGTLAQLLVARDVDAVYAAIATAKGELDAECLSIAMHRIAKNAMSKTQPGPEFQGNLELRKKTRADPRFQPLLEKIETALSKHGKKFTSRSMAMLAWALAKMSLHDAVTPSLRTLEKEVHRRGKNGLLGEWLPQELAMVAWAYGTERWHSTTIAADLQTEVLARQTDSAKGGPKLEKFKAQELKDLVWGATRMGASVGPLYKAVSEAVILRKLTMFKAQETANLVWGIAHSKVEKGEEEEKSVYLAALLEETEREVSRRGAGKYDPMQLSQVLDACVAARRFSSHLFPIFEALAMAPRPTSPKARITQKEGAINLSRFRPQELKDFLRSFAVAKKGSEAFWGLAADLVINGGPEMGKEVGSRLTNMHEVEFVGIVEAFSLAGRLSGATLNALSAEILRRDLSTFEVGSLASLLFHVEPHYEAKEATKALKAAGAGGKPGGGGGAAGGEAEGKKSGKKRSKTDQGGGDEGVREGGVKKESKKSSGGGGASPDSKKKKARSS